MREAGDISAKKNEIDLKHFYSTRKRLQDQQLVLRFYIPLVLTLCFALPAIIPWYYWGESFKTAFFVASIFRYVFTLNVTW